MQRLYYSSQNPLEKKIVGMEASSVSPKVLCSISLKYDDEGGKQQNKSSSIKEEKKNLFFLFHHHHPQDNFSQVHILTRSTFPKLFLKPTFRTCPTDLVRGREDKGMQSTVCSDDSQNKLTEAGAVNPT
ncbi:hypothetical protein CEXT_216821 [Caerostris extrusa]|uniref:Uncharacterized protein n=1 Tax=Caerostris extrusa TaxID=172846 RepID=A0AAV4Q960_CAEEX|nr:hypothetical protein CEXT_216821 [Caerostris extrusa]